MVHHGCCVFFCPPTAPPIQHCIFMHFSRNIDFKLTPNTVCLLSLTGKLPLLMPQQCMSSACLWTECCLFSVKLLCQKKAPKTKRTKEHPKAQPSLLGLSELQQSYEGLTATSFPATAGFKTYWIYSLHTPAPTGKLKIFLRAKREIKLKSEASRSQKPTATSYTGLWICYWWR